MRLPSSIQNCIDAFSQLPTIGRKSAERFVFYLLQKDQNELDNFAEAIKNLKKGIKKCAICGCIDETTPCLVCADAKRDRAKICVITNTRDLILIENTKIYNGLYHVLGGNIDAINGITPKQLNIKPLLERLRNQNGGVREIILALNPTFEGETTSLHLTNVLKNYNIKLTRLARGLSAGSDLQYADELTIKNAIQNRK